MELSTGEAGELPSEFRIFKAGLNKSRKGSFEFTGTGARECMERIAEFGADYPVDYNHAMFRGFSAVDPASEGRAAGWFKPKLRNGELWATEVQWTTEGAQRLAAKEYRYISPAFNRNEKGEICELLNVALTNVPALTGLSPLMASQIEQDHEEKMEKILTMLGLKSDATEGDIETAMKAFAASKEMLLAATTKATEAEAKITELSKRLADMQTEKVSAEVDALLDSAKRDGRVSPAQAEALKAKGVEDLEFLKTFLSAAIKATPEVKTEPKKDTTSLSEAEKQMAKAFGLSHEKIVELQSKRNQ